MLGVEKRLTNELTMSIAYNEKLQSKINRLTLISVVLFIALGAVSFISLILNLL